MNELLITSPAFENNRNMPEQYTCDGENINPPLDITGVDPKAVSLALIVDDPDAPTGVWVHWIKWNIDPSTSQIDANSEGFGVHGVNSGIVIYQGPCPPSGTHRYFFKLFSLDAKLDIAPGSDKATLEKAMEGHILQKAELIGLYKKKE